MSVYVITGAGTDIGKTYVTSLLVRQLKAAGRPVLALKPVVSGVGAVGSPDFAASDTAQLLAAQGLAVSLANVDACSPWRFAAALSPDMAAAAEGRTVELEAVLVWCRRQIARAPSGSVVLIEGVGGVMSPMASDGLNLDFIKALGCEVVLVVGSYLGALTHALTAIETLKAHHLDLRSLVLNQSPGAAVDLDATAAALERYGPPRPIVTVRRGESAAGLAALAASLG